MSLIFLVRRLEVVVLKSLSLMRFLVKEVVVWGEMRFLRVIGFMKVSFRYLLVGVFFSFLSFGF